MSITIEIDDQVRGCLGGATDWNSMLYRRQLTGALFREQVDGSPGNGLLTVADVPDNLNMVASISPDALCASGEPPTVKQIAQALCESSQKRSELFLFNLLSRIRARGRYLEITSRIPGLDIARLMSSPQFGIHGDGDQSTASFRALHTKSNASLRFQHIVPPGSDRSHPVEDIEIVVSKSPEHALTLFYNGAIDMTCPTSLSQSVWQERDQQKRIKHFYSPPKLLIGISLLLPHHLRAFHDAFDNGIDRTRAARSVYNNIYPASNWSEIWNYAPISENIADNHIEVNDHTYLGYCVPQNIPLVIEYAAFTPNREIAVELAQQLSRLTSYPVTTREIDYSALLDTPRQSNALRLILRFFPWAHPAAMLYPSLADPQSNRLIGTASPDSTSLFAAYKRQQRLLGEIVLGGLRPAMLTRLNTFEFPPTGWFDFSDLSRLPVKGLHQ